MNTIEQQYLLLKFISQRDCSSLFVKIRDFSWPKYWLFQNRICLHQFSIVTELAVLQYLLLHWSNTVKLTSLLCILTNAPIKMTNPLKCSPAKCFSVRDSQMWTFIFPLFRRTRKIAFENMGAPILCDPIQPNSLNIPKSGHVFPHFVGNLMRACDLKCVQNLSSKESLRSYNFGNSGWGPIF